VHFITHGGIINRVWTVLMDAAVSNHRHPDRTSQQLREAIALLLHRNSGGYVPPEIFNAERNEMRNYD